MPESRRGTRGLGDIGETVAAAHLRRIGWTVLAIRYRCPAGEIDIVAQEPAIDGRVLVFVEVKLRRGGSHGSPAEAVDARKRERLLRVARNYLGSHSQGDEEPAIRFDIVEVFLDPDGLARVELRRGAFGE